MNIKHIFTATFAFSTVLVSAQQIAVQLPTQFIQNQHFGNNNIPSNVIGSPFLSEEFTPGKVMVNDKVFAKMLRYNAYADQIEMKIENDEISSLVRRHDVDATIGNSKFKLLTYESKEGKQQNYGVVLSEGTKASLYKRFKKDLIPGKEATSSYSEDKPARFDDKQSYLLKLDGEDIVEMKLKKKDILKKLESGSSARLTDFIAENKLKMNKEEDFIRLITFYNQN